MFSTHTDTSERICEEVLILSNANTFGTHSLTHSEGRGFSLQPKRDIVKDF